MFSHWLKGHVFTAWADNNPLPHIPIWYMLHKLKLNTSEQCWVAKIAAHEFDIKYVPGPKNVVAFALSQQPFAMRRISQCLISEPYRCLLKESESLSGGDIQDVFRWSNVHQATQKPSQRHNITVHDVTIPSVSSLSAAEV